MKLTCPDCFYPDEEEKGLIQWQFRISPGCVSGGGTLAEAILMAMEAASGWVLDMDSYTEKFGEKEVRKSLREVLRDQQHSKKNIKSTVL